MDYSRSEAKEAAREQFHGVWSAITTPFTDDFQLDEEGIQRIVRYNVEELKIDGMFCTGVMGEFWSLTPDEWKRAIELVVEAANGETKIIAHTGHHSPEVTVDLTRHAEEVGADFSILITPYFPPRSHAGVYDWFRYVCDRVNIGVWMFDPPYLGENYRMSPELINDIADIENVCGMKQAWDIEHHKEVYRLVNDKIVLSFPKEPALLEMIRDYGQQVHMSSPTPILFQQPGSLKMREYSQLAHAGDFEQAAKLRDELQPYRDFNAEHVRGRFDKEDVMQIAWIKEWTRVLGLPSGPVRPPLQNLTPQQQQEFRDAMDQHGILAEVEGAALRTTAA